MRYSTERCDYKGCKNYSVTNLGSEAVCQKHLNERRKWAKDVLQNTSDRSCQP